MVVEDVYWCVYVTLWNMNQYVCPPAAKHVCFCIWPNGDSPEQISTTLLIKALKKLFYKPIRHGEGKQKLQLGNYVRKI
jgi:hypothetical protein